MQKDPVKKKVLPLFFDLFLILLGSFPYLSRTIIDN